MDSKKLFPDKKVSKRKVLEFLDKKGFYVVLILCILIVGVTAVILTTRSISPSNTNYDSQKIIPDENGDNSAADNGLQNNDQSAVNTGKSAIDQSAAASVVNESSKNETASSTNKESDVKKDVTTTGTVNKSTIPKKKDASQKFLMPVFGQVCFEYAEDKLVYSKTLEEWRTHSGVDIAADRGTPVKVVADGVVTEIKNDPMFGITIIVDHQDGTKTIYANLASDDTVSPNQKVKQGDVIGAVGNTATFESAEQSHLHFEVLKDDESVDPTAYLPKQTSNAN